jgi:hypothetical protein
MFKLLLISIVVAPVLLGIRAATSQRRHRLLTLLTVVLAYDVLYVLLLCYLRVRWVGWGTS